MTAVGVLAITSALLVAVLTVAVVLAARRLSTLDQRLAPTGAKHMLQGPEEGSRLPSALIVRKVDGSKTSIGAAAPRPLMLVFLSSNCRPCADLAVSLRTLRSNWSKKCDVLLLFKQPSVQIFDAVDSLGLQSFDVSSAPMIFDVWGIRAVPFAVILDADGVVQAKGIVNNLDHLEYLADLEEAAIDSPYEIVRPGARMRPATTAAESPPQPAEAL